MSVRQYIGARYVPRFVGTWNNTTQYEALDVVDNGAGTSYIARKNVPAGTPLNDSEFWFVYGASSGAIIDLQSRVGTLEGEMNAVEQDISELEVERIIGVGDSYVDNGNLFINAASYLPSNKYNIMQTALGGASFSKTDVVGANSYKKALENLTVANPETIDRVIIAGGYNEAVTPENIPSGVTSTISYIKSRFVNAVIEYIPVGRSNGASYNRTIQMAQIKAINELKKAGVTVYDNALGLMANSNYFDADNVHPNSAGYTMLSQFFAEVIASKKLDVYRTFKIDISSGSTGLPFTVSGSVFFEQINTKFRVYSDNLVITRDSGTGRWQVASGSSATFIPLVDFAVDCNNKSALSKYPFVQTNEAGADNCYMIMASNNVTAVNVLNLGSAIEVIGLSNSDDAAGTTSAKASMNLNFDVLNAQPRYSLSYLS